MTSATATRLSCVGLSYRQLEWPLQMYFALRGVKSEAWIQSREAANLRHRVHVKALAAQIIQAIGRTRCRKVIDTEGRCLPTVVFIALPDNAKGAQIISAMKDQFPGANFVEWPYRLEGSTSASQPTSVVAASRDAVRQQDLPASIELMMSRLTWASPMLSQRNLKNDLKNRRRLVDELEAIGVTYFSDGKGRGARSFLMKS